MKRMKKSNSIETIIKNLSDLKHLVCPVPLTLNTNIGLHIDEVKQIYKNFVLTPIFKDPTVRGLEARDKEGNTIILNFENEICSESYFSMNENEENK